MKQDSRTKIKKSAHNKFYEKKSVSWGEKSMYSFTKRRNKNATFFRKKNHHTTNSMYKNQQATSSLNKISLTRKKQCTSFMKFKVSKETDFVHRTSCLLIFFSWSFLCADFFSWNLMHIAFSLRETCALIFLLGNLILLMKRGAWCFFFVEFLYDDFCSSNLLRANLALEACCT